MLIVTIETWPMPEERKPELIKKLTEVFTESGIPAEAVTIIIHENQKGNWGTAGEQHSVKYKDIGPS